jgi:hypothetical protein
MSDYVCERCLKEARFVFVSLDTVVSAACEKHRKRVYKWLVELAWEPANVASSARWADLAELHVENYSDGMTVNTCGEDRDLPWGGRQIGAHGRLAESGRVVYRA